MDKSSETEIKEALEYLVQSPYIHHHYFDAYETPVRLDMELTNGDAVFPVGDDFSRISECAARGVRLLRFFGGEQYEHLDCLLAVCRESWIQTEVVLKSKVSRERLAQIIKAGVDGFLVEIESAADTEKDAGVTTLSLLGELNYSEVRAKWFLRADNAAELAEVARRVETLGAKELIIAGMCADTAETSCDFPDHEALERTAQFIETYESEKGMTLSVDTCFSPLRAFMGGEDPKRNPNRGISCGCEAGRSFCAVRVDGKFSPCLYLIAAGEEGSLVDYWNRSLTLEGLRETENSETCGTCTYVRRCRPCPAVGKKLAACSFQKELLAKK